MKPRYSMRTTLGLTIGFMGVLGMILALTTGEIYRRLAYDNQREAMAELVAVNVMEHLHGLEKKSRDLGIALQAAPEFQRAYETRNQATLIRLLNNLSHSSRITPNPIKIETLQIFDADFNVMAKSVQGDVSNTPPGCPQLIARARQRPATQRLETMSELCLAYAGRAGFAVLVPMGGTRIIGYLEVVSNPVHNLLALETSLGVPLKITLAGSWPAYRSPLWPPPNAMQDIMVAQYDLKTSSGETVMTAAVMRDIKPLHKRVREARYVVIAIAGIATLLGVVLALISLERTALRPLQALTQQLRLVEKNKAHLGEQVTASGIAEIHELATVFNRMTAELQQLYVTLEHMAFTDPLTRLPNRVRFHDSLAEFTHLNAHSSQRFALLLMDLNRFKEVNDALGHHAGDLLLLEVSKRMRGVLRGSDLVTRLDDATILELENKMVARLGGDEFAAILPSIKNAGDAILVARKLLLVMEEPFIIDGHRLNIGMSIGIAMYPEHGQDNDTLMRRADAAMYEAKNNHLGFYLHDQPQDQPSLI